MHNNSIFFSILIINLFLEVTTGAVFVAESDLDTTVAFVIYLIAFGLFFATQKSYVFMIFSQVVLFPTKKDLTTYCEDLILVRRTEVAPATNWFVK